MKTLGSRGPKKTAYFKVRKSADLEKLRQLDSHEGQNTALNDTNKKRNILIKDGVFIYNYDVKDDNTEELKQIAWRVTISECDLIREEAKKAGFDSLASYMRAAWVVARRNPDLIDEARQEVVNFRKTRPMSFAHPDAKRRLGR
jgi:hypothetical protein